MVDFVPFAVSKGICGGKGLVCVTVDCDLESMTVISLRGTKGGNHEASIERFGVL